jgi:hypothetical protein
VGSDGCSGWKNEFRNKLEVKVKKGIKWGRGGRVSEGGNREELNGTSIRKGDQEDLKCSSLSREGTKNFSNVPVGWGGGLGGKQQPV